VNKRKAPPKNIASTQERLLAVQGIEQFIMVVYVFLVIKEQLNL